MKDNFLNELNKRKLHKKSRILTKAINELMFFVISLSLSTGFWTYAEFIVYWSFTNRAIQTATFGSTKAKFQSRKWTIIDQRGGCVKTAISCRWWRAPPVGAWARRWPPPPSDCSLGPAPCWLTRWTSLWRRKCCFTRPKFSGRTLECSTRSITAASEGVTRSINRQVGGKLRERTRWSWVGSSVLVMVPFYVGLKFC